MANDRYVLITGTSTGIGKATALYLDRMGMRVFACVRKQADADMLRSEASDRLVPIILDVTDSGTILDAKQEVCRLVGEAGLWGIVNNAGVGFHSPVEFTPLDSLRSLFEVNVFGLVAVTQAFLPLVRQARGRIVNISSEASIVVSPFHGPYSASKLAVNGFSTALRRELMPFGVQVSVIISGSMDTLIFKKTIEWAEQIESSQTSEMNVVYGKRFHKMLAFFQKLGQDGIDPQAVARAVTHALTAKRARHSYLVGRDAHLYYFLDSILPEAAKDWVTCRVMGL